MQLVAANREKWLRSLGRLREGAVRKWIRESTKAPDKRKVAKERYEARRRVAAEEKQDEKEKRV